MPRLKVTPTRASLKKLETRLQVATQGFRLLKDKQDSLIREFMVHFENANILREQIEDSLAFIQSHSNMARTEMSDKRFHHLLSSYQNDFKLVIKQQTVMGFDTPLFDIEGGSIQKELKNAIDYNYEVEVIMKRLTRLRNNMVKLSEKEALCTRIAKEIKDTRRRVNALEYRTIPDLKETISYINLRIDDQTRGHQSRIMKVVKKEK